MIEPWDCTCKACMGCRKKMKVLHYTVDQSGRDCAKIQELLEQLKTAREALEPFTRLGCSDINCRFRDNDYGTNGGCRCIRPSLKERSEWRIAVVKANAALAAVGKAEG